MKLKVVSGIMLTLLLIGMLTLTFNIRSVRAEPGTWTVDDDGPADFHTIQEAVDAASDGDTVFVYNGTYGPVVVDKAISLVGEDKRITIIEGSPISPYYGTVSVLAGGVNVSGFTIRKSFLSGIVLGNWTHEWSGEIISDITFYNNLLYDCRVGIWVVDCDGVILVNNVVTDTKASGVTLTGTANSQIDNNSITNNLGYGICDEGIKPSNAPTYNIIQNNTITCNAIGIFVSTREDTVRDNVIAGNTDAGIMIKGSNNVVFHNSFFNKGQVISEGVNVWDDGYPSGGNYWSDYVDKDEFSGPNQDQPGSDGIGDNPYIINENNPDRYPLMTPILLHEHDLASSVWAPDNLITGTSTTLEATVYNLGLSNETNVELQLLINDIVVASEVISKLASGSLFTINHSWAPTIEALYNVTTQATPVPNELTTTNNAMSKMVSVYTPPAEPTEIYLSPSESHAFVGSVITIDVMVANVEDLYAWEVKLYFDPDILSFREAWLPPDNVFAGKSIVLHEPILWTDEGGTCVFYGCCLLGTETRFYGSGTLCQMNFTGIAYGSSNLTFGPVPEKTFLLDFDQNDIPFTVVDGLIVVEELEGDLNTDGKVDMRDISLAAAAFGSYPDHPRWNPIADINKDNRVNMRDLATIARNFGKMV